VSVRAEVIGYVGQPGKPTWLATNNGPPELVRIAGKDVAWLRIEHEPSAGLDFSFDVVEVRHLDSVSQEGWFPEIPPGTTIANHITGKNSSVPWSSRQRQLIAEQAEEADPPVVSPIAD
jgi:hypothetical protein